MNYLEIRLLYGRMAPQDRDRLNTSFSSHQEDLYPLKNYWSNLTDEEKDVISDLVGQELRLGEYNRDLGQEGAQEYEDILLGETIYLQTKTTSRA